MRKANKGYLGGSPGARIPSPAWLPASVARPQWGRRPTGSASSHGRRRPLAGRGRGKGHRGRGGCPQPGGRSGTQRPAPVAHVGRRGIENPRGCGREDRPGEAQKACPRGRQSHHADLPGPLLVPPTWSTNPPIGPIQPQDPLCLQSPPGAVGALKVARLSHSLALE